MKTTTIHLRGAPRAALATLLGLAGLSLGANAVRSNVPDGGDVESARGALEKWVETRRIISKEKTEWQLGREVLDDRIAIVQREIEALREKIEASRQSIADADDKLAELCAENERNAAASAKLAEMILGLEDRARELLGRLPDPVRDRTRPVAQRFPTDPEAKASAKNLGARFLNVIGVLNEINRFHREITVTSEVRELPNGTTAEVTALYIGVSQAYYVNGDGTAAGLGTAGLDGWLWTPADGSVAKAIETAVAVLQNQQEPAFVQLPIQLR